MTYRLFKEHCQNNGLSHKDVLTALRGTSKYYGAFIGEIECYSARVTKYLNAFNMIKQTTVLPLLFRVFYTIRQEHQQVCNRQGYR